MAPSSNNLPRRVDSLVPHKAPFFLQLEDELRDVKRVNSQGQEEDLRMALTRTISRVEELSAMLKEAYKTQTDMQTELTLAKSNLQLALANNEMLEDVLKRNGPGASKEVGWRRSSARELEEDRRISMDSARSVDLHVPSPAPSPVPGSPLATSTATPVEGRFFKFRFGNSASAVHLPISPRMPSPVIASASHLTSASLPSLVPSRDKEVEDLSAALEVERKALKTVAAEKAALESELESLSQALFEEANKMVATERMRLAETTDELREALAEKEALRSALRLVEGQQLSQFLEMLPESSNPPNRTHAHKRSTSSAIAIKSCRSSAASSPRSIASALEEDPLSSRTVVPPPLLSVIEPTSSEDPDQSSDGDLAHSTSDGDPREESAVRKIPSPLPSPSPSPGPAYGRAVDYFDGEASPWLDA